MKDRTEIKRRRSIDPNLDIPAEANRGKHANFLDTAPEGDSKADEPSEVDKRRQRRWKEGIKEGENAANRG